MGSPKIIKTDNGSRYVTKTFHQFCSQWNIEHRAKHSLQSSRATNSGTCLWLLENTTLKDKNRKIKHCHLMYFLWMPVSNLPQTDFGVMAPKQPLLKQGVERPLNWIRERTWLCHNLGLKVSLCFVHRKKMKLNAMTAYTAEEWQHWCHQRPWWLHRRSRKEFLNQCFWLTPSHFGLRKEGRWLVIPSFLIDLLHKLPDLVNPVYVGARPETQTEHLTVLYFGTHNLVCQCDAQSAIEMLKEPETKTSIFS